MKQDHQLATYIFTKATELGFESDKPDSNILFIRSNKLGVNFDQLFKVVAEKHPKVRVDGHGWEARIVTHIQVDEEAANALIEALKDAIAVCCKK
jgi:threonine aldolase